MLSINNSFDLKYHWLTNSYILEIFANILMSYVSFMYIDTYTIKANIIVSSFLISFSFFLFMNMRYHQIYSTGLMPFVFSRLKNIFMVIGIFFLLCLKSFFLIRFSSMVDITVSMINESKVLIDQQTIYIAEMKPINFFYAKAIIISGFITAIFLAQCRSYYNKIKEIKEINAKIYSLIEQFNLDKDKTKFFVDGCLEAFEINEYLYFIHLGLMVDGRIYNKNTVMDYFNVTGISFNDLNNGHITSIQMYGV